VAKEKIVQIAHTKAGDVAHEKVGTKSTTRSPTTTKERKARERKHENLHNMKTKAGQRGKGKRNQDPDLRWL
jgi:hypothetical protein